MLGSLLTVFIMGLREVSLYGHFNAHAQFPADVHTASLRSSLGRTIELPRSHSCNVRAQVPRTHNGVWQVFRDGDREAMVFGAYYDDRKGAATSPVVRVFGVSSASKHTAVFCQLWYGKSTDDPVVTVATVAVPGRGYRNAKKIMYQEYMFSCPVRRNDSLPINVSLSYSPCQNSTIHTAIVYADRTPASVEFGVCVAAAYGDIQPRRIAEWAELLSILGVREINIYVGQVTNRTRKAFSYYQKKGLMVVRQAPSPLEDNSYWARKLAVIPGFNDCVYRNMYRYNYTVIIDFDEVIVPHMHSNYSAMMADLRTFHKRLKVTPGLLIFRNAYFFLDLGMTYNMTPNMTIMSHTRRVDVSPRSYSAKSIFDPRVCVIAWNHFCLLRVPRTPVLNVDPLYALSHHYKKCHFKRDKCQQMMRHNVSDTTILKFKVALRRRLKKVHIT